MLNLTLQFPLFYTALFTSYLPSQRIHLSFLESFNKYFRGKRAIVGFF
jgi:hypothetical protein